MRIIHVVVVILDLFCENVLVLQVSSNKTTNSLSLGDFTVHEDVFYIGGSENNCPLRTPSIYRQEHEKYLVNTFGTFKVNVTYNEEYGYYKWQEIGPKYGKLLDEIAYTKGKYAIETKIDNGDYGIVLTNDTNVSYVCGYDSESPNFCTNYDEICGQPSNVRSNCYCSMGVHRHFCQILICNDNHISTSTNNSCRSCDNKLENYGHPSIELVPNQPQERLFRVNLIAYRMLKPTAFWNNSTERIYIDCYTDALSNFPELYYKYHFTPVNLSDLLDQKSDDENIGILPITDKDDPVELVNFFYSKTGVLGHYWCEGYDLARGVTVTSTKIILASNVPPSITMNITVATEEYQIFVTPLTIHQKIYHLITSRIKNHSRFKLRVEFLKIFPHYNTLTKLSYRIYGANCTYSTIMDEIERIFDDSFEIVKKSSLLYEIDTISLSAPCCLAENVTSPDGKFVTIWPETEIGAAAISNYFCMKANGDVLTRMCNGEYLHGAYWGEIEDCYPMFASKLTRRLIDLSDRFKDVSVSNKTLLNDLTTIVMNTSFVEIGALDIHLVVNILEFASKNHVALLLDRVDFLDIVARIIDRFIDLDEINSASFQKSQQLLNSTDRMLYVLQDTVEYLGEVIRDFTLKNVRFASANLTVSTNQGLAFYPNSTVTIKHLTQIIDLDTNNLEFAVFVPEIISIHEQISKIDTCGNETVILRVIAFKSYTFFTQKTKYRGTGWSFGIFLEKSVNYRIRPPKTQILIKPSKQFRPSTKFTCNKWTYGLDVLMFSTKGSWKSYETADDRLDGFSLCHITLFIGYYQGLLIDGEEYTVFIDLLTYIGGILSIIGTLAVILTAFLYRDWGDKIGTKILSHFAIVTLLHNICQIVVGEINIINYRPSCITVAALTHYFVLTQFIWSLIFGYLQYQRYVKVFSFEITSVMFTLVILISWGVPLIPVGIVLIVDKESYISVKSCALSGPGLLYGLYLPFLLITIVNLCVFITIIRNLPKNNDGSKVVFFLNFRLAILLFFMFGFFYIFSLLAWLTDVDALTYAFSISASAQGFVISFYYMVWNEKIREFWWRCLKKISFLFKCDRNTSTTNISDVN